MVEKKVLVLLYDTFVAFELTMATHLLKHGYEIITVAPEEGPITEWAGLLLTPHHLISEVDIEEYSALIIPGGRWEELLTKPEVSDLIRQADAKGLLIGAICAAPVHLAKAGVLKGHKFTTTLSPESTDLFEWDNYLNQSVVIDGKIVTAKGNAYVEFAVELIHLLGIVNSDEEKEKVRKHYKNIS